MREVEFEPHLGTKSLWPKPSPFDHSETPHTLKQFLGSGLKSFYESDFRSAYHQKEPVRHEHNVSFKREFFPAAY